MKDSIEGDYIKISDVANYIFCDRIPSLKMKLCEGKKKWHEKARMHIILFGTQHPYYEINDKVKAIMQGRAFNDVNWGKLRNKSKGILTYCATVRCFCAHTKQYSWISDRQADYFAAYNKDTHILYYEAPYKKPKKENLLKTFDKQPDDIKLFVINKELNVETKRELIEKFGEEKYMESCEAKVIHEDVDHQGNKRQLMILNNYGGDTPNGSKEVRVVKVICPSTGRVYFLKPVYQQAATCEQAVMSTFSGYYSSGMGESFAYRHGDIALFSKTEKVSVPFSES